MGIHDVIARHKARAGWDAFHMMAVLIGAIAGLSSIEQDKVLQYIERRADDDEEKNHAR